MDVRQMMRRYLRISGPPTAKGWQSAHCPFHEDRSASFGIHLTSGVANCYVCGSFSLKAVMSRVGVPGALQTDILKSVRSTYRRDDDDTDLPIVEEPEPERLILNELLLGRMLPATDPAAQVGPGFTHDTLRHYGVVVDPMRNRVVWPIRDQLGRLRALSGRLSEEELAVRKIGKYKVYRTELHDEYPGYEPYNREYLFGFHEVFPRICVGHRPKLLLVEGYKAAAWVHQAGYRDVSAVMGAQVSPDQVNILTRLDLPTIILFLDNNKAGWYGTFRSAKMLLPFFEVLVVPYPDDREQPDDLSAAEVQTAIASAIPFLQWSIDMSQRRSMSARAKTTQAPRKGGGGGGSSEKFTLYKKDDVLAQRARRKRIRFIPGSFIQDVYNHASGEVEREENKPHYTRRIHWSPYGAKAELLPYSNAKWQGPIECTAGPDQSNPQPCVGCYLAGEWFVNTQGENKPCATDDIFHQVTVVELAFFHPVQKTSQSGANYISWEYCLKDERSGRGRCHHCEANKDRVWGRRAIWELKDHWWYSSGGNDLSTFNDVTLGANGICGCEIFPESFACASCGEVILNLDQEDMSDEEAAQWSRSPRTCPHCGHVGAVIEQVGCSGMNERGPVENCIGTQFQDIWNTDIFVDTVLTDNKKGVRPQFIRAGNSGPLPYAPPSVENWPELFATLSKPHEFDKMVKRMSVGEQVQHVGLSSNPFREDTAPPVAPTVGNEINYGSGN